MHCVGKICNFLMLNLVVHTATAGAGFKLLNADFPSLYDRQQGDGLAHWLPYG